MQYALDIAGLVPGFGEPADLLNAAIHLGRGNHGEALLALGAMVPIAGAGITAGKFAQKAGKAIGKHADKAADIAKMAGVKQLGQAGEVAAGVAGPKKGILGPLSGKMRFPDDLTKKALKEAKNVKKQGWTAQLKDYAEIAKQKGVPFELWVRESTNLSGPLQAAEARGDVFIKFFGVL